jgi:hypothetical protein
MRRVAKASIARDGGTAVESDDISEALQDMIKLNVKLPGGRKKWSADERRMRVAIR